MLAVIALTLLVGTAGAASSSGDLQLGACGSVCPGGSGWLPVRSTVAPPQVIAPAYATVSPQRRIHILYGDRTGGGHRAGSGEPGKTLFPASWSDDDIIGAIESVANDPGARRREQPNGRVRVEGTRSGVRIRVIVSADGTDIITGYPLAPRGSSRSQQEVP